MAETRTDAQLFNEDPETGCWNFVGRLNNGGYGELKRNGIRTKAHRYFYEKYNKKIEDGLVLDHLCRNRSCVKPSHLREVTPAENTRSGSLAKLSPDEVKEIINSKWRPQWALARQYGVSQQQISKIKTGTRWAQ